MSLNIVCERPECRRPLRVNEALAGKRVKCSGCGHAMVVPGGSDALEAADAIQPSERRKPIAGRATAPRRPRRWPLFAAALLGLVALSAGLAYHFEWPPFQPSGPGNRPSGSGPWGRAVAAKLTLIVGDKDLTSKALELPKRDYAGATKKNLLDAVNAQGKSPPEWERSRLLRVAETSKKDGALQATVYLFSDGEANWPRDERPLKLEIWGSRMPLLYDLKLDGQQQPDGSFKGQATGRLIMVRGKDKSTHFTFEDAEFRLEPWSLTEKTPGSPPKAKPELPSALDPKPEVQPDPKPSQKPDPKSVDQSEAKPKAEPKAKVAPAATALKQHVKSLRLVLPGSTLDLQNLVKRVHELYEPHGVKVVIGNITEAAPLKEDAILALTYDRRRGFGESLDHDITYVWIDVAQQFVVTANSIRESTFGAFSTPFGFAEKFKTSFVPPLFIRDVRSCLSTRQVADEDSGIFAFGKAVVTDDGRHLLYAKTVALPSEQEKKLGKKAQWELRVLDCKQNKVVARQPCQGEELFLHGTALCTFDDRFGATGLEVRDVSRLPDLGPPSQLFVGKKVTKVAAAGRFLCAIVDERLHVLSNKGAAVSEMSVDDAPTAASSLWAGPTGRVWMREAVPKDAKRIGDLRIGRIDAGGRFQMEGKASFVDMDEGDAIAAGLGARYALGDKWAASIAPYHHQSALRLYDLASGKPRLVHKLDGVAGKDIVLYEDLCAVLDDSALRLFSIAEPRNIQRLCDVPLGKKMSSKGVPINDLSQLSFRFSTPVNCRLRARANYGTMDARICYRHGGTSTMIRWFACSVALILTAAEARGHFLFVRVTPPAEAGRAAEVYFSERAEAGDPTFINKIAHTQLWLQAAPGKFTPLAAHKRADRLRAPLPGSESVIVIGKCEYGVLARKVPFLLRHYPKAMAGVPAELNRMTACDKVPLEIAAQVNGDSVRLTALKDGKPLADAVFIIITRELVETKLKAGADGSAEWKPTEADDYSVYIQDVKKQAGTFKDKKYEEIRDFATLAFTWPLQPSGPDPKAVALFQEALAARSRWDKFTGFSAKVAGEVDGRRYAGSVSVDGAGEVTVDAKDETGRTWVQEQLDSIVLHRAARSDARSKGKEQPFLYFGDHDTAHPLGRLLIFRGGRFASSYRVKDKQIMVVNRHLGKECMTITALDNDRNAEGRFIPRSYTVQYWDAADGKLRRTETVHDRWVRIGAWDLPAVHTVTIAGDGGLSVRSFTLTGHQLEKVKE